MRNNIMNDAKVEKDKQYVNKFDFSAGNSNTASIGRVDIGFSQMLVPGSKLLIKQEQLVRMAPLVAPSYVKQYFKTWGMQIPIEDVWPNFSPMMTKESVSRNGNLIIPEKTPYALSNQLVAFCLTGAHASLFHLYDPDNSGNKPTDSMSSWEIMPILNVAAYESWYALADAFLTFADFRWDSGSARFLMDIGKLLGIDGGLDIMLNNPGRGSFGPLNRDPYVTEALNVYTNNEVVYKPDFYIITRIPVGANNTPHWFRLNFRLSSFGRQIFKNLKALGYPMNLGNTSARSLLPMFAAYKAYWDIFGLNQFQNWEETNCARLITYFTNQTGNNLYAFNLSGTPWNTFKAFILDEFAQMWVTEKDDYISAHLPQPTISPVMSGLYGVNDAAPINDNTTVGGVLTENVIHQTDTSSSNGQMPQQSGQVRDPNGHAYMNIIQHSHLDSEALKRLYKMTNRNTMLGREIAKLMESRGLGMYMQRSRVNMIGETTLSLNVDAVFSTSDTYNDATGDGAVVGDYAGRGVGYRKDEKALFCKTDSFCFVIVLTAVTADCGYSQGEDMTTRCITADDFFQPAFEALGQELHEKSVVCGNSDGVYSRYENGAVELGEDWSSRSFGYATRYSGWKVGRSCSNGGFALASERDNFIPFIGDKLMFPEERFDLVDPDAGHAVSDAVVVRSFKMFSFDQMPVAGNAWRFLMRYPWMQNLLRFFRNKGKQYVGAILKSGESFDVLEKVYLMPENYMIFDDFWVKCWAPMLPIAETYGTIDPDKKELEFVDRA